MFEYTKRFAFVSLALVLINFLLIEVAGSASRRRDKSASRGRVSAEELFRNNCARCHGADGRGDTPLGHTYNTPDFTDPEWRQKHSSIASVGTLVSIVSHGNGGMPAFGRKLTRTEIRHLVDYVRRFSNQKSSP